MRKTAADERRRALVFLNTDLGGLQHVRIDNTRELLGQPREMRDISVEHAQCRVPEVYEATLQPGQAVILYGER